MLFSQYHLVRIASNNFIQGRVVQVSKAEYDYGTAGRFQSCPRYRRQSSILSAVPPVPYSQTKGISWVFAKVEFFIVRLQESKKQTNNFFANIFFFVVHSQRINQVEHKHKIWIREIFWQRQ